MDKDQVNELLVDMLKGANKTIEMQYNIIVDQQQEIASLKDAIKDFGAAMKEYYMVLASLKPTTTLPTTSQ